RLGVLVGEDLEGHFAVAGQLAVEIDDLAVDLGGDGGLGEALADGLGDLARPGAAADFALRAVGEFQGQHEGFHLRERLRSTPTTGASAVQTRPPVPTFAPRRSV